MLLRSALLRLDHVTSRATEGSDAVALQFLSGALRRVLDERTPPDVALYLRKPPSRSWAANFPRNKKIADAFEVIRRNEPAASDAEIIQRIGEKLNELDVPGPSDGWTNDLVARSIKAAKSRIK